MKDWTCTKVDDSTFSVKAKDLTEATALAVAQVGTELRMVQKKENGADIRGEAMEKLLELGFTPTQAELIVGAAPGKDK